MSPDYHYLIHGLVLASEVELPHPKSEPRPPDVTYRIKPGGSWLPAPSGDPTANVIVHRIGKHLAIEFTGLATFEISRTWIVLLAAETDDPDVIAHLLLAHIVPSVVSLRGDLVLHASGAVGPSGNAHLFLGWSGSGKSTLGAALGSAGWPLLDDDGVRVIYHDGRPFAVPGGSGLRLLPDAAAAVIPDVEGRPQWAEDSKCRFALDGRPFHMASSPAPIAGLCVLERGSPATPAVERLDFAHAVATIVEHGVHMIRDRALLTRKAFERASALAATAPVWRLSGPNGLTRLDATVALINELDKDVRRNSPSPLSLVASESALRD